MNGRRKWVAALGLLAWVAGCDRRESDVLEPAPPAEPAATVLESPATPPAAPPPAAAVETLALRFVTPNIGPPAGGNGVTIDGRGFDPYPRVSFGGAQAWIRSVTRTEIRVTVPPPERPVAAGETRIVDVRVTNPPSGSEGPVSEALVRAYSYVGEETPAGEAPAGETAVAEEAPAAADPAPATEPATVPPPSAAPPAVAPGPTLVANFTLETVADSEDCPPPSTAVRFTDRSTGGVSEWFWDFGDGSTSEERHPEHCYAVPGLRSVSLTVSGGGSSTSVSKIVIAGME